MGLREAVRFICEIHTATSEGPHGFKIGFGTPPDFVKVDGNLYWEAWRVLREYAAPEMSQRYGPGPGWRRRRPDVCRGRV